MITASRQTIIVGFIFTLISIGIIFYLFSIMPNSRSTGIYKTPEAVVEAYLQAVSQEDRSQISKLVAPDHDTSSSIEEKLKLYGGMRLDNVKLIYKPTESPYSIRVSLQALGIKRGGSIVPIDDLLHLQRQDKYFLGFRQQQWFLVLGTTINMPVMPTNQP